MKVAQQFPSPPWERPDEDLRFPSGVTKICPFRGQSPFLPKFLFAIAIAFGIAIDPFPIPNPHLRTLSVF